MLHVNFALWCFAQKRCSKLRRKIDTSSKWYLLCNFAQQLAIYDHGTTRILESAFCNTFYYIYGCWILNEAYMYVYMYTLVHLYMHIIMHIIRAFANKLWFDNIIWIGYHMRTVWKNSNKTLFTITFPCFNFNLNLMWSHHIDRWPVSDVSSPNVQIV